MEFRGVFLLSLTGIKSDLFRTWQITLVNLCRSVSFIPYLLWMPPHYFHCQNLKLFIFGPLLLGCILIGTYAISLNPCHLPISGSENKTRGELNVLLLLVCSVRMKDPCKLLFFERCTSVYKHSKFSLWYISTLQAGGIKDACVLQSGLS